MSNDPWPTRSVASRPARTGASFLRVLDEERIAESQASLRDLLETDLSRPLFSWTSARAADSRRSRRCGSEPPACTRFTTSTRAASPAPAS